MMTKKIITKEKDRNIIYYDDNYNKIGKGYLTNLDSIALTFCPNCSSSNHESNVKHGICAWCGWDANGEL